MRALPFFVELSVISLLAVALAGCGKSGSPSPSASNNYTPSRGAFAAVPASSSQGATVVNTCNLDAVNGKPTGSEPVSRGSVATFSGWAADAQANSVPVGVQLVLQGTQDYVVNAATGAPRPDVAEASKRPAWKTAGYSVEADLSAIAPGTYTPVLEFSVDGRQVQCKTEHHLTIQ